MPMPRTLVSTRDRRHATLGTWKDISHACANRLRQHCLFCSWFSDRPVRGDVQRLPRSKLWRGWRDFTSQKDNTMRRSDSTAICWRRRTERRLSELAWRLRSFRKAISSTRRRSTGRSWKMKHRHRLHCITLVRRWLGRDAWPKQASLPGGSCPCTERPFLSWQRRLNP